MKFAGCFRPISLLVFLVIVVSAGCSKEVKREMVYRVKGKVTLGGAPIANAMVVYSPKDKQPVAMGRTNDEGIFTLTTYKTGDGAAEGNYVVLVTKDAEVETTPGTAHSTTAAPYDSKSAHGAAKKAASTTALVPEKYGSASKSPLKATVKKDAPNDNHDQELKP